MIEEICRDFVEFRFGPDREIDVDLLIRVAGEVGLDSRRLRKDLESLVAERIALQLIGPVSQASNYNARRRGIVLRFARILGRDRTPSIDSSLVKRVAKVQTAIARAQRARREGIQDVEAVEVRDMMARQGNRCSVCGVPLRASGRRATDYFGDGAERVGEPSLEHQTPFYLVGNDTEYEVLCRDCNTLKNDRIGVQEDGFVLCGNVYRPHDREVVTRRMIFWSLRDRPRCDQVGCGESSRSSSMFVSPVDTINSITQDNLRHLCLTHVEASSIWIHA